MPDGLEIIIILTWVQLTIMEILIFWYVRSIKTWVDEITDQIPGLKIGKIVRKLIGGLVSPGEKEK